MGEPAVVRAAGCDPRDRCTGYGRTTFSRYLYRRLSSQHDRVGFLDGDMGQAILGPPTTMTLVMSGATDGSWPPDGPRFHTFVGSISPVGHMLETVVGAQRLVKRGREKGATAIVYDTTGLVVQDRGGGALERALVGFLMPEVVIGLQRGSELEHLLVPFRCSRRTRAIDQPVSAAVQRRDAATRRTHRAEQYRRAFDQSRRLELDWRGRAVILAPTFTHHRLVALEDVSGFVFGLGIVTGEEADRQVVELYTPVESTDGMDTLHVGDVAVDPHTFCDERLR